MPCREKVAIGTKLDHVMWCLRDMYDREVTDEGPIAGFRSSAKHHGHLALEVLRRLTGEAHTPHLPAPQPYGGPLRKPTGDRSATLRGTVPQIYGRGLQFSFTPTQSTSGVTR